MVVKNNFDFKNMQHFELTTASILNKFEFFFLIAHYSRVNSKI